MAMLSKLLTSCCLQHDDQEPAVAEKEPLLSSSSNPTNAHRADEIVSKFLAAKNDIDLQELRSTVKTYSWYDGVAKAVLEGLERAIELGQEMGPVMKEAFERAVAAVNNVKEWVEANPVKTTLIALGVLALMVPWMLAFLGFSEAGIVEASWAALWQARYLGFVPKGSLFSFLQSLGTKIGLGA